MGDDRNLRHATSLLAGLVLMIGLLTGCTSSGRIDSAARDRCEQRAGVGNCVVRDKRWVPLGSRVDSSTTPSTPTTSASSTPLQSAPPTIPTSATTVPATSTTAPTAITPRNVLAEPAGLLCRDLGARGYSYSAAVDYWRSHGQPNQMDADRNGIPCETVFPRQYVTAYWGMQQASPPSSDVPSGLSCKDLYARGESYSVAVAYWYYEGVPARMDVDGNGIPCETVYPASIVNAFWYG